jgi:transposase
MEAPLCAGCGQRDALLADLRRQVAELTAEVADLKARLATNSRNSSLPPSANPLGAPKPVVKKKSRRRRGGQAGHPPHLKELLPPERVTHFEHLVPTQCQHCHAALSAEASADDPTDMTRFQTIELRPVVTDVTEYQGHARTCRACGTVTRAVIPAAVRQHAVGPRLTATLSYFSGCHGVSKRGVEEIAAAVLNAPVSLGTVANLEQEVSAALEPAHQEALTAVREAEVKGADETSWKLWGQLCWLWAAASANVVAFVIHPQRSALGLTALLGADIHGLLSSDRWSVYNRVPPERRQVCWAHLKRDFQKIVDRGGPSAWVGHQGRTLVKKVFAAWQAFQDGQDTRVQLQAKLAPVMHRLNRLLLEGAILGEETSVATFCENVLALEPALWTFARVEGVEPTNNHLERLLRRAVLWRRRSFGCASVAGCRFVERILTVVQTRRLQGQSVLDYLHDALRAHRAGQPCPSLLPIG